MSTEGDAELHEIRLNLIKIIDYTADSILLNKILLYKYKKTVKLELGIVFIYLTDHIDSVCKRYLLFVEGLKI